MDMLQLNQTQKEYARLFYLTGYLWDDVKALDLSKSNLAMLFNYLTVHEKKENINPFKQQDLTNFRNCFKDDIINAKSQKTKKIINDCLSLCYNIKNEKEILKHKKAVLKDFCNNKFYPYYKSVKTKHELIYKEFLTIADALTYEQRVDANEKYKHLFIDKNI